MTGTLRHRGPDEEAYFLQRPTRWPSVGFGFRRLSIIDVEEAVSRSPTRTNRSGRC